MNEDALKSEFGEEATFHRLWLSHLNCHGTQVSATVRPETTESETLTSAWNLVKALASWLLSKRAGLPENERYEIIVGWSVHVRSTQGQIFKTGGAAADLRKISASVTLDDLAVRNGLRPKWQKDVFDVSKGA